MMTSEDEQKAIEEDFSQSWNRVEQFFAMFNGLQNLAFLNSIISLITELRERGYDRKLRAGQAMTNFILSRSREHGLQIGQARLTFRVMRQGGMEIQYCEANDRVSEFEVEQVKITPEIEALLARLLAQPID